MQLYWSSRSPFVRKVMIAAHEVGLAGRLTCERTLVSPMSPNLPLLAVNPLGKLPTLVLEDGTAMYDSRVICEYLDTLHAGEPLFPRAGPERLTALTWQALGDGIMDFLLQRLTEGRRPEPQRSGPLLACFARKLEACLRQLEGQAGRLATTPFGIGHISIGCALAYVDFRFAGDDWRARAPALAGWHAGFNRRPSVLANEPVDA